MITDDSNTRLASLDSEKYGNMYHEAGDEMMIKSYSQGLLINGRDLLSNTGPIIESSNSIDNLLNGGVSLNVDVSDLSDSELMDCISSHMILISSDQFTKIKFVALVVQRCPYHQKYVKTAVPLILQYNDTESNSLNLDYIIF